MRLIAPISIAFLLATPATAVIARDFTDNDAKVAHTCSANERINIAGNDNVVDLSGPCGEVVLTGNDLKVSIAVSGALRILGNDSAVSVGVVAAIEVLGNENKVSWERGPDDKSPEIKNLGQDNEIQRVTPAKPTAPPPPPVK